MAADVNNEKLAMLVDTGANVTILSEGFVEKLSPKPEISPCNINMITATGQCSPFKGQTDVIICLGQNKVKHHVLVANISNDGILGMDFLTQNKADLLLSRQCLRIQGEEIPCFRFKSNAQATCCRVSVSEDIVVPACSELILMGRPLDVVDNKCHAIVEPSPTFVERTGLLVAKLVVDTTKGVIPLRLANLKDEPYKIFKDTVLPLVNP